MMRLWILAGVCAVASTNILFPIAPETTNVDPNANVVLIPAPEIAATNVDANGNVLLPLIAPEIAPVNPNVVLIPAPEIADTTVNTVNTNANVNAHTHTQSLSPVANHLHWPPVTAGLSPFSGLTGFPTGLPGFTPVLPGFNTGFPRCQIRYPYSPYAMEICCTQSSLSALGNFCTYAQLSCRHGRRELTCRRHGPRIPFQMASNQLGVRSSTNLLNTVTI